MSALLRALRLTTQQVARMKRSVTRDLSNTPGFRYASSGLRPITPYLCLCAR
jgi:hypothetical protein